MMQSKTFLVYILLSAFILTNVAPLSAQSVAVLGEVKSSGKVSYEGTGGQWVPAPATYPILQNTGLRTDDGTASLYLKDGSRIDLSKNSQARIDGSGSQYSVQLMKGVMAFNIPATASLSVRTATASISVNRNSSLVQKVSLEKSGRVLGIISATDQGTEVKSISGRIAIDMSPTETRLVSTGESIFIGADSTARVYQTQALGKAGSESTLAPWIIGGTMAATVAIFSIFDVFRASPHGFD